MQAVIGFGASQRQGTMPMAGNRQRWHAISTYRPRVLWFCHWMLSITLSAVLLCFQPVLADSQTKNASIKIALLHLSLSFADLDSNYHLIEKATRLAADAGAQWVVTPELALTGYRFDLALGTDWIGTGPDSYVQRAQALADELDVSLFLSHLEGSLNGSQAYNTLFVIDSHGEIIGKHHKINTIPISEDWSTAGKISKPVTLDGHRVGLLICADAWPADHADALRQQGAEMIISSASWGPGIYGPGDTWEKRSSETGLPVFVANKTGRERGIDQSGAVSVVSFAGQRLAEHRSKDSSILLVHWNTKNKRIEDRHVFTLKTESTN